MDNKEIQELIKLINKSNIGELTVERKDFKLTIRQREDKGVGQVVAVAPQAVGIPQGVVHAPAAAPPQAAAAQAAPQPQVAAPKEENLIIIRSPMIGTFYRRPSPDKPLFVEVGDDVSVGKVVCIIEAMKLFNEIESEVSGKVVKILVDDSTPVEYDQPLFLVDPS
jgi:acetyl-CoA carboxylase biotin carboxyl carrier protein